MECSAAAEVASAAQHVVICVVPGGPAWWTYIPGFLAALVGCIALYFARASIRNARNIARDKATLDLIEKRESTEHYRKIHKTFSALRRGRGFAHLNNPANPRDERHRSDIVAYLNHYELVSIGILTEILDAKLYRAWMEGAFVRDWNAARDWVQRERWEVASDGSSNYRAGKFENYQKVAMMWSTDALDLIKDSSLAPQVQEGPGDEPLPEPIDDIDLGN